MSDYLPPPRSILSVEAALPEEGGGLLIACDCGTTTQLVIDGAENLTERQELAFTCDGCQSVTWFTVGPVGEVSP